MNILTDILSLIKRKQYVTQALQEDVIVLGVHTEPEIEGIASPVPYKNVKLIKIKDFIEQNECLPVNVPIGTLGSGVFRDKTIDPLTSECYINFRKLKSLSLNLIINESIDNNFVEFDCLAELNTVSNIGGGAEVFKQKVGEDFEFRTLISADSSVTITQNPDTIDLSASGPFGIWSTTDVLGQETFYSLYADALAAAVAGDTITLHTDIEISTGSGLALVDDININLNGFTYTYSNPDTSDAMSDVLSSSAVSMRIYNGTVIRKDSAIVGGVNDTMALAISSNGTIGCVGVNFINLNGWACLLEDGTLNGIECTGSQGGISCGTNYILNKCYATGTQEPGIKTTGTTTVGNIIDCIGTSSLSNGIELNSALIVTNCIGNSYGIDKAGILLTECYSKNLTGYSSRGSGIIIVEGETSGSEGKTDIDGDGAGLYPNSGIVLVDVGSIQNVTGYSFGFAKGLSIIGTGIESNMIISNSSGHNNSENGIGIYVKLDESAGSLYNDVTLQNCSAFSKSKACEVEQNPTVSNSNTSFLNCAFTTVNNIGVGIKSIGTNNIISYSNCSFKIGTNPLGLAIVAVVQKITNTSDNQGNTLL
jgi:hypothetical protein